MKMVQPASGGLLTINGTNGGKVHELSQASSGKPGKEIIPNRLNILETIPPGSPPGEAPQSACNRQTVTQNVTNSLRQRVEQALQQLIRQQIQQNIQNNPTLQNLQQEIQQLIVQQQQGVNVEAQIEIINKQIENQISTVVVPLALRQVQEAAPTLTRAVAQGAANPVAVASQSIRTVIPQSVVTTNISQRYGAQAVQTVRQACSV